MELRFQCATCGQHVSATSEQIGATAPCPNCNAAVTVPIQSSLPPPVRVPPQTPQPKKTPHVPVIKRTKSRRGKSGIIVLIGVTVIGACFVHDSQRPKLFAKVEVTPKFLSVTNGNGTASTRTTIILNDAFAGPILEVSDDWAPNETKY